MGRMHNKVAIVTGAAQGIGRVYAKALAAEGAKVVVTDIQDPSRTVQAIESAGGKALGLITDVTSNASLTAMTAEAESAFGPIEILVNNAAVFATLQLRPFTEIGEEEWDLVMRVNVRGPFQAAKAVLPSMRKNGRGKIINISSGTVLRGAPGFLHYVTSKGAVLAQSRSLSRELAKDNVCVNTIIIGFTESEGVKAHQELMAKVKGPTLQMRAIARDMVPQDIVGTLLYLASEDSDFVTGQSVNVDGGALNQ
ncbi:MAG: SDR family oxidoreductase [Hyphomonadaceae bacterium]|nr:SDR family oxidoreductase [Hyphomonadaceae bacterium]